LLIDAPAAGSWNMAVDQALLESVSRSGEMVLRFYQWEQPTLSLGYFQSMEDRSLHEPSLSCPVVRRATGGGAILHDQELTYSLCVPSEDRWSKTHELLYWTIHGAIIECLADWGVEARTYQTDKTIATSGSVPGVGCSKFEELPSWSNSPMQVEASSFLCFQRRSAGDIVLGNYKVCGSAQRRKFDSVLQHGSILFKRSNCAPELPGIEDLAVVPAEFGSQRFTDKCWQRIEESLGVRCIPSKRTAEENVMAAEIEKTIQSPAWLDKSRRRA
jgi:lipoate-protein ligase A